MHEIDCTLRGDAYAQVPCDTLGDDGSTTCPAGCQDVVDTMYADCGGTCSAKGGEWDTDKNIVNMGKELNEGGCSGAAAAAPVLALAAAAMAFFA